MQLEFSNNSTSCSK